MKRLSWLVIVELVLAVFIIWTVRGVAQTGTEVNRGDVLHKAEQSMALIFMGDGSGHVRSVTSGVTIRADGIVLTPYHLLKNAQEVQVRLRDGEVYDQVELIGFDERRDMAVLHIPASGLSAPAPAIPEQSLTGEKIHVLTADERLAWSAYEGVLGPVRLADEVMGAGHGYRVVEFMAPIPQGAVGGALVDVRGQLIGIVPASVNSGGQQFAVPVQSVAGLPGQGLRRALGSGKSLMPPDLISNSGLTWGDPITPALTLATARTLRVTSHTVYFTPFMLEKELLNNADFRSLEIDVMDSNRGGELVVNVDRPVFTYDFTYSVSDPNSGSAFAMGKVTAIDGPHAAHEISKKLVEELQKGRASHSSQANQAEARSVQP